MKTSNIRDAIRCHGMSAEMENTRSWRFVKCNNSIDTIYLHLQSQTKLLRHSIVLCKSRKWAMIAKAEMDND